LFIACERGNHEIVGALLTVTEHYPVDPNSDNTVLHAAVKSQNEKTIDLILDAYAKQMNMVNNEKSLPIHLACELGSLGCVKK
jgi:ankyrin repeat protein